MDKADKMVAVGRLAGPHGIKGHVKFVFYGEDPALIDQLGPLYDEKGKAFTLKRDKFHKNAWLVHIDGYPDRTAVEALPKMELYLPRTKMPEPSEDEIYLNDLLDLDVFNEQDEKLGFIAGMQDFGAGPLIEVITNKSGTRSFLLPYHDDFIVETGENRIIIKNYQVFTENS